MRIFLIGSLLSDWSSHPYSISVSRFHPSEELSLDAFRPWTMAH
jgi:hypothetical protein